LAAPSTDVHKVADRKMPVPGGEVGLRIYTPRPGSEDRPFPIVVHFHGAGFVAGDLDTHDSIARFHCKHADAVVIAVDYRLAPEHPFPAAVDDAYAAVEWAVEHARELSGDARSIAVLGDSAGSNLAAVVCQLAKARNGPRIAFQALVYPVVDFRPGAAYSSQAQFGGGDFFLSNRDMEFFRSCYLTDVRQASDPRVSPLLADDLAGLPPALVVTAGCDPLRDEGRAYADRLAAAGVPVEYRCFESTIHAFMSFAGAIPVGVEGLSFVASRLRAALHAA
jgi:acetyl esterase